jgi:ferrous iron transport protein B
MTTLNELKAGNTAMIVSVNGDESLRHHLLDMGLIPGVNVTFIKAAPMGDPIVLKVRDFVLTLRRDDAAKISIDAIIKCDVKPHQNRNIELVEHPKFGEDIKYNKNSGRKFKNGGGRRNKVIEDGDPLTFALVGNQNSGKTTLFNQLTGSSQHVGNFPGVTVDRKEGKITNHPNVSVTDLPGIYSLSPYSTEEIVTREFLLNDRPLGIINIIDATNIERNLYLTMQLIELNIPMVLALNMMDEVRVNGGTILVNNLEALLGIPVVPISASKNEGIEELINHAINAARTRRRPFKMDFCDPNGDVEEQAVHRCIHATMHLIEDHAHKIKIPPRFAATKIIEGDKIILKQLNLDKNEKEAVRHLIVQLEEESNLDRVCAIVNMRFNFIEKITQRTVIKPISSKEHIQSQKIDQVLTGKHTAIPAFLGIMAFMFWMTFSILGPFLADLLSILIDFITYEVNQIFINYGLNSVVHSLVIDGIFAGVGSVLSFLPIIVVLFFFLSLLEDSGYMARVAFIMDKSLRKLGLSGRSFVPMLLGFGCSVPAIMSTRTLSSNRDRKMTILLIPFMSCSAKLPIYVLLASAFFPKHQGLIIISMYSLGIIAGIIYAVIMKETKFKGEPIPFVMELPNYRFPSFRSVSLLIWEKSKDFITKAFTIIFIGSIIVWFLQSFDIRFNEVSNSTDSLLAMLGGFIAPIFKPLGLGDWRISTALLTGLVAKESVVSTLTVLLGNDTSELNTLFTPLSSFVFLIFTLYYTPCIAAIAAIKVEFNSYLKTALIVISQCVIAWILAYIVHIIGVLLNFT